MTILSITYGQQSANYRFGCDRPLGDGSLRKLAVVLLRGGQLLDRPFSGLSDNAFDGHVIERPTVVGEERIFIRPPEPGGRADLEGRC